MSSDNFNLLSDQIENIFAKHAKVLADFQSRSNDKKKGLNKRDLEFALTVLLVELASADQQFDMPEYNIIISGLKRIFGTNRTDVAGLINQANLALANLRGSSKFGAMLKDNLTVPQRECILEVVQEVIEADGKVDGYEIYVKNKIANLLGIPAEAAAGPESPES